MTKKYRRLSDAVVVEAIQFVDSDSGHEIGSWILSNGLKVCGSLYEGKVCSFYIGDYNDGPEVNIGDWVIKGIDGDFYPFKEDVFKNMYEECKDGKVVFWKDKIGLKVFKFDFLTFKVSQADIIYRDNEDGSMNENGFRWIGVKFNDLHYDYEPALNLEDAIEIFKSKIGK